MIYKSVDETMTKTEVTESMQYEDIRVIILIREDTPADTFSELLKQ